MEDKKLNGQEVSPGTKSCMIPITPQNLESPFKGVMVKVHVLDNLRHVMKIKPFGHRGDPQMEVARDLGLQTGAAKRLDFCSRLPTATNLPSDLYDPFSIVNLLPDIADYLTIASIHQSSQVYVCSSRPMCQGISNI